MVEPRSDPAIRPHSSWGWLFTFALLTLLQAVASERRGAQFLGWTDLEAWRQQGLGSSAAQTTWLSPEIEADLGWNELVVSWNADCPAGTGLIIEARVWMKDRATRFYQLGKWSPDGQLQPRESVPGQKDPDAEVQTDTLVLAHPAQRFQLRLRSVGKDALGSPRLRFLGAALADTTARPSPLPANRAAWRTWLAVPERSQLDYPGGETAWCSPTSTSMILGFWAARLNRAEIDQSVPAVVKGVLDPRWPGTGNWPFNTAFAGALPGMRGYVARLTDVSELEDWIAAGVPVAVSVSYDQLRGRTARSPGDGHLVVCVGFTEQGDPIVNDPGTRHQIRRTFHREHLITAWRASHNTVYLIYPESQPTPTDRFGHWCPTTSASQPTPAPADVGK